MHLRRTVFKWVFDWLMPSMGKVAPCGLWSTADLWKGLEDSAIRKREILKVGFLLYVWNLVM